MIPDNKFIRSLLQNAQRGNFTALEQLFRMNIGKVYAIVLRMTANKSFASKITVDTFLEAWKKLKVIREDSPFTGWLIAIAVYKTLEVFRNNKEEFAKKPDLTDIESKDSFENDILSLPHLERLIFVLNKVERYSIDEIADMILMKKEDVEFHLNLAVEKLHDKYPLYKFDNSFQERISKLPIEIQPDKSVTDEIFNFIYEERMKIAEKENAEKPKAEEPEPPKKEIKKKEPKEPKESKKKIQMPEVTINFNTSNVKKYIFTGLGVLVIAALVLFWLNRAKGWTVSSLGGNVLIDNVTVNKEGEMKLNSTLLTDENSNAKIIIPHTGVIEAEPNTSISRTRKDFELKVSKGKIIKKAESQENKLTIQTDIADFNEELSSDFELTINEERNSLFVFKGTVKVVVKGFESVVPENFACDIRKGKFAVPYNPNSDKQIINLIKEYSGPADPNMVVIVSLATKSDALSLWHILQLSSEGNRPIVFKKLNELVPPPDSVTKEGIQKLNRDMLDQWLVKIISEI
ncbi:DNA-directed RNA polymerase specialized sigma subunit [Ignavibacterium album JCM 16511]|uniref:DNA-directed RNA polymerase specialized sigma subunit n=1 Tax=Ignavibacterium album (strain DSM 19864 / JCM 16511 / NBRC 101810 / Mat9-16) TaxID=945713 RepID=I0ANX9_IGNAJ|nr:RNA polymerase sigma factor [Ignavibacterium album]AFH50686.1 DNA-directed RNA polymerase specialized sigma subunit [Ignavibacterium album JCM 16511]